MELEQMAIEQMEIEQMLSCLLNLSCMHQPEKLQKKMKVYA